MIFSHAYSRTENRHQMHVAQPILISFCLNSVEMTRIFSSMGALGVMAEDHC